MSNRRHLEQARKSGANVPELDAPYISPEIVYLWNYFIELSNARSDGPIGYTDILSWCKLSSISLKKWELGAIVRLDATYLKVTRNG
mgnify:CR=1 FL=1